MPCLSITRLKLRHAWSIASFLTHAGGASKQIQATPGFIDGYLGFSSARTYWTVSLWTARKAMDGYRTSGAHADAMRKVAQWCEEAAVATIETRIAQAPDPHEIGPLLEVHARLTRLDRPSAAHLQGNSWPDRRTPRIGMRIRPI